MYTSAMASQISTADQVFEHAFKHLFADTNYACQVRVRENVPPVRIVFSSFRMVFCISAPS